MAIEKMKRIRVIAMAEDRERLLYRLQRMGCVEITEPTGQLADPKWSALLRRASSNLMITKGEISDVIAALDAIKRYTQMKDGLFIKRHPITERDFLDSEAAEQAKETCHRIGGLLGQLSQLTAEQNRLQAKRASLLHWSGLDVPLELKDTRHVLFRMCVCPAAVDIGVVRAELSDLAAELMEIGTDREQHYLFLVCHRAEEQAVMTILRPHSFSMVSFQGCAGTPAENLDQIDRELNAKQQEQNRVTAEIVACRDARDALRHYADRLNAEAALQAGSERLLTNGTIVFFEGWAPEKKMEKLQTLFEESGCAWEAEDPKPEEEPPVLLSNPKWMEPINMVTEMYSLPAYRGIDPNPLIFWFFIFFFGFMFADVAYGIILFVVSTVITRKYAPKGTMGYLFGLGRYLGISTTLCGIFTAGFFGDAIPVVAENFMGITADQLPGWLQTFTSGIAFSPIRDPMTVLLVALVIGAVQLVFGQCIHIYMCFRDHQPWDGIMDVVPWWVVFVGIGLLALGYGSACLIIGAILLICTQGHTKKGFFGKLLGGVASLYNITSWLSDVLSYSRLMALMLATSVIASVMNTLGALPRNLIAFVIVFLIGHTFNIGVNLIGTYVHAARLQYLEFYGKFYEEGGVPFQPLIYNTKYVDIIKEEE